MQMLFTLIEKFCNSLAATLGAALGLWVLYWLGLLDFMITVVKGLI